MQFDKDMNEFRNHTAGGGEMAALNNVIDLPPLFVNLPMPLVTEDDIERALAQEQAA